jgi:hypothetical protein
MIFWKFGPDAVCFRLKFENRRDIPKRGDGTDPMTMKRNHTTSEGRVYAVSRYALALEFALANSFRDKNVLRFYPCKGL